MVKVEAVRKLAMQLEGVEEQPHFEKASFRVKKKIFLTVSADNTKATLKLSLIDQDVFHKYGPDIFYPVPNAWGKQGWTIVDLKKVRSDMFRDALTQAYNETSRTTAARKKK